MEQDAKKRRRWFGGIVLAGALIMLICGETVLHQRLNLVWFLSYWLICLILTGLAVIIAFRDLRDLQQQAREQQRELLENTLKGIETEARSRKAKAGGNN